MSCFILGIMMSASVHANQGGLAAASPKASSLTEVNQVLTFTTTQQMIDSPYVTAGGDGSEGNPFVIENLLFKDVPGTGAFAVINIQDIDAYIEIRGNTFEGNSIQPNWGIFIDLVNNMVIENNVFDGLEINGIGLYRNNDTVIRGNTFRNLANGIWTHPQVMNDILVENNIFDTMDRGIDVTTTNPIRRWTIRENIFVNMDHHAIRFQGNMRDNKIYQNNFLDNSISKSYYMASAVINYVEFHDSATERGNYYLGYLCHPDLAGASIDGDVWDTPYLVRSDNYDEFPLVNPSVDLGEYASLEADCDALNGNGNGNGDDNGDDDNGGAIPGYPIAFLLASISVAAWILIKRER